MGSRLLDALLLVSVPLSLGIKWTLEGRRETREAVYEPRCSHVRPVPHFFNYQCPKAEGGTGGRET